MVRWLNTSVRVMVVAGRVIHFCKYEKIRPPRRLLYISAN